MKLGLAIFSFDRLWLNAARVEAIQRAFEVAPPSKAGASDPLEAYRPGLLVDLYARRHFQVFVEAPVGRTSGRFQETYASNDGRGSFGQLILRLRSDEDEALASLKRFAVWLGGLQECAYGTWCEAENDEQYDSGFCHRGFRSPEHLNQLGLARLATTTFFGEQLVGRLGAVALQSLGATLLPGGNVLVELPGGGLSGADLVAQQEARSKPLIDAGWVAPYTKLEKYGEPAPNWEPLRFIDAPAPTHQAAFDTEAAAASPLPAVGDAGPALERLRTRWRQVEADTDFEDQQQVAMELLDALADLQSAHPDRLDLLKYRVPLLACPLEQWADVKREMEPLRAVPDYAEMVARFDQEVSVQPFS